MKHFKRLISVVLALLMIISGAPLSALAANAQVYSGTYISDYNEDYNLTWEYNESSDTLYLDAKRIAGVPFQDPDSDEWVYYLPVYIQIDGDEFLLQTMHCPRNIVFGKNVEYLDEYCLGWNNDNSYNISFEDGCQLKEITESAFETYTIDYIKIPNTVDYIGSYAFAFCDLGRVLFEQDNPNKVYIESNAFRNSSIFYINFYDCNTSIPQYAFTNSVIVYLYIPQNLKTIGNYAFAEARIYTDINLPDSLEVIGFNAFQGALVHRITFPNNIKSIFDYAFNRCTVQVESVYSYYTEKTSVGENSFTGSNITLEVVEPETDLDYEQHNISGHYTGKAMKYDLDWSYNAETDTLYLDGYSIEAKSIKGQYRLPLVYESESGIEKLWMGTYHHIVFSNKVEELISADCLGITDWEETGFVTVDFADNSHLEYIAPKAFQNAKIKRLILPDTVYDIDDRAFYKSEIEYIRLPNYTGDEEIYFGEYVFSGCKGIEINFNGFNLEALPNRTFQDATLNNFAIPSTVKSIGKDVFENANINSSLTIPSSVESIDNYAFYGAKINGDLTIAKNISNIRAYAFHTVLVSGNIVIGDNVTSLVEGEFMGAETQNLYIGKGISSIPDSCFNGIDVRDSIQFSNEIESLEIGASAFRGAEITSFNFSYAITSIGIYAFADCIKLTGITVDDNCRIKSLPEGVFYNCTALESFEVPSSVETVDKNIFSGCTNLKSISFKEGCAIEEISESAFSGMSSLESFEVPDSVRIIGKSAFEGCSNLASVTFADTSNLEEIGEKAFYQTGALTSITIPKSVVIIGADAFNNSGLCELSFEAGSHLGTIGNRAFNCCKIETLTLPESLKSLGASSFLNCTSLVSVQLPTNLETMGNSAFAECSNLETINIPSSLTDIPAYTFNNDAKLRITIPSTVVSLGEHAFYACSKIAGVPSSITYFGASCLEQTGIVELDLSNKDSLTILANAFNGCERLTRVSMESSIVTRVGQSPFENCINLTTLIMPDQMPEIPYYFAYGTHICDITLPENISEIDDCAFSGTNITHITVPRSCITIGAEAFSKCILLERVDFESNSQLRTIKSNAFSYCDKLSSIRIPDTVTTVGSFAFYYSGLSSVTLPSKLSEISKNAFSATEIQGIAIPDRVETIGDNAFSGCENLVAVTFSENSRLTTINPNAFNNCSKLAYFDIPKGVTKIGKKAFARCNLSRVVIPESCTSIEAHAFAVNPLKVVIVLNKNTSIGAYSLFYNSTSSDGSSYYKTGMLYGYSSSTASRYASSKDIPFTAIDSVEDPESIDESTVIDVTHSYGTWENGTWNIVLSNNKILYVEGSGAVPSATVTDSEGNVVTFAEIANEFDITTVFVGDGITALPDYFLYDDEGCGINYVRLPDSLKSIGSYAFAGTSVVSIYNPERQYEVTSGAELCYIPKGVNHIGEYAFAYTDSISGDFILPKELTEISEGLFYNSNTPHVEMFGKVTKIGKKAFADCYNMTTLYVPCSVTEIYSDGNVNNSAFGYVDSNRNTNLWVCLRNNSAAHDYCLENGLNSSNVLGVPYRNGKFGDSGVGIGFSWEYYIEDNSMVLYMKSASSQVVDTNWKYFYEYDTDTKKTNLVIQIKSDSDLKYIDLKADKVTFDGIYEFNAPNFLAVLNPKEVKFNNFMRNFGARTFANCTRLERVELPTSTTVVGAYCFENCTSLKQVRLGYGMTTISPGLFSECRSLESVDLGNVVLQNIGEKAFYNCNALKFVNLNNQTSYSNGKIGAQAFYNCVNLQEINIPDNIKTIETKAFYNCVQAQSLNISGNVETIGKDAFANLFYCENITINSEINSSAISNERDVFANLGAYTNGIELNIGSGVERVDFKFFDGLNITALDIGSGVKTLENKQYLAKLKAVSVGEGSKYTVKNSMLYSGDQVVLAPQALTQITFAPNTRGIAEYAFYGTNAKSITLPESATALGEYCFAGSKALIGINLSDGIIQIPEGAFKGCEKLRLANLPNSAIIIQRSAFEDCTSLLSVMFNNSLYTIGDSAFKGCSKLEGLAFPEGLNHIGDSAFANCSALKYAYIWHTTIGDNAFANDEKLNIFTPVGSDAYRYAREVDIPYSAYTDEELFFDEWAIKVDAIAGYLGYCEEDGHGNIQYLTVYEADCENDGYVIGVCEYCSEILEEIHIDAYGHSYKIETEIPATATTRGITVHTCERCHQSYTEYTSPLDENYEIQTHTVSGTVYLAADRSANQGIAPAKNASILIDGMVVATTDSNGAFSFETETGAYKAEVRYAYGFTRTIYIIVNNRDIDYQRPIIIVGCDFSKDGIINDEDIKLFQMIISAKQNDPSYLNFVDLNADGYINAKDLLYIKTQNGLDTNTFKYPLLIIS